MVSEESNQPKLHNSQIRISRSRSGFTERSFVLVYKHVDGSYSQRIKISRATALEIAQQFASTGTIPPKYDLDKAEVQFIVAKVQGLGLLNTDSAFEAGKAADAVSDTFSAIDISTDDTLTQSNMASLEVPAIKPTFFPNIDPYMLRRLLTNWLIRWLLY